VQWPANGGVIHRLVRRTEPYGGLLVAPPHKAGRQYHLQPSALVMPRAAPPIRGSQTTIGKEVIGKAPEMQPPALVLRLHHPLQA
jgi:hypothetical protein